MPRGEDGFGGGAAGHEAGGPQGRDVLADGTGAGAIRARAGDDTLMGDHGIDGAGAGAGALPQAPRAGVPAEAA